MKGLISGGACILVLSLFAAILYAQTAKTDDAPISANESLVKIENTISDNSNIVSNKLVGNIIVSNKQELVSNQHDDTSTDKKLVKKTGSVSARGASRGSFSATAYCLSGKTAMGHGVRRGIIAADPRVLKLGSTITIAAGPYSGTYLVSDTGGSVKGKRLDIWMPSCSEARRFGRRSVQVFSAQ